MSKRIARSSLLPSKPRQAPPKKNQKRSLEAFSIAAVENPERFKVRRHRLGELEPDDEPSQKRRRVEDESDGDEEEDEPATRSAGTKARGAGKVSSDASSIEEDSDSDGNTWQVGHVNDDDDSDLDSDEAFNSSDEERFEDFVFRGSSKKKRQKPTTPRQDRDVGKSEPNILDENDSEAGDDGDSFGEDGIDLAAALDQEDSDLSASGEGSSEGSRDASESEESELSQPDEDESDDEDRRLKLQELIRAVNADGNDAPRKVKRFDVHEARPPSQFGVKSGLLTADDLLSTMTDGSARKSLKLLSSTKSSKRKGIPEKATAPLPKRQQARLDRIEANKKAKETLDRWVETVKHNRRAEHLTFPLREPDATDPQGTKKFIPTTEQAPANQLESAIQNILQESGLVSSKGHTEEDQIKAFEELQTNKMSVEEVLARRAELRRTRDLLFREERKAKRIKKIKSKAYRRVHRKDRERAAQAERDALIAEGVDVSEDEREVNDRRRAEERMGQRHRESRWAKGMKESGRAVWDEDARSGVTEMARRNEELRRRIAGKPVERNDGGSSSGDDDEEESFNEGDDDAADRERANLKARVKNLSASDPAEKITGLAGMKFMQRAEEVRRAQNQELLDDIRREIDRGHSSEDEAEVEGISTGRKIFGPNQNLSTPRDPTPRQEFEEGDLSDGDQAAEEDADEVSIIVDKKGQTAAKTKGFARSKADAPRQTGSHYKEQSHDDGPNPWIEKTSKRRGAAHERQMNAPRASAGVDQALTISIDKLNPNNGHGQGKITKGNSIPRIGTAMIKSSIIRPTDDPPDSDSDNETPTPLLHGRNQALAQRAFASDDVVAAFESEKADAIASEDEQTLDTSLPGWGNWVGSGISKRQLRRQQHHQKGAHQILKREGVKPADRRDAKLDRVILNERRVKKNARYMASGLPHPFETREQYERSLRMPIGAEWSTKESVQAATRPRVVVKPGVVHPMERPFL